MKFYVLGIQTIYYLITAVWALVDIRSFISITGPKTDIWLVKTVAVLLLCVCACFATSLLIKKDSPPVNVLAISCCIGFLIIDCYYSFNNIISDVYLFDAGVELILLVCWGIIIVRQRRTRSV
ncbi:MAG TPA: hypothetical protein VFP97_04795 [Chitinophagaceae bacterium]|nr:hypothetical protein [Chitinophagaceae bacterium]